MQGREQDVGLGFSALQGCLEEAGENGGRWARCYNWAGTGGAAG